MEFFIWFLPFTIEVTAWEIASVVSMNYTIWIHHRNDFKYKVVSELECTLLVTCQIINNAFDDKRRNSFTRMGPACYEDGFFLTTIRKICNSEHFDTVLSQSSGEQTSP